MFRSRIYSGSSPRVQEALIYAWAEARLAIREGRSFRTELAKCEAREAWTEEQLLEFQAVQLRPLLKHAAKHVAHYREVSRRIAIDFDELDPVSALQSFPILTKFDVLNVGHDLLAKDWHWGRFRSRTSGTSGTPLTIVQDLPAVIAEQAFIARQLAWTSFRSGDRKAWIRGEMVVPFESVSAPHWRLNRAENALMMSSYHLSEGSAPAYLDALAKFGPTLIQAYPSSISFLARFLRAKDRFYNSDSLRAVLTSSETLFDEDRELIEERFGCKVFDWYGAVERVAAIGTCEKGSYHLLTDYSYVELQLVGEGKYEVIGTGFNNKLMPLIRYRTGDLVELPENGPQCGCGRRFPVVRRVIGRQDDALKLPDGRRVGRIGRIFYGVPGIAEAQVIQDELDSIRIHVVPFMDFPASSRRILVQNSRERLGVRMRVSVEVVSSIPRTENGKFRTVVCNV